MLLIPSKDVKSFAKLSQELHHLEKLNSLILELENLDKQIKDCESLIKNEKEEELVLMAKEDLKNLKEEKDKKEKDLKVKLLPQDPSDKANVILEIRAGAGGDEASLFAQDLFEAYSHYASSRKWKMEMISTSPGTVGGFKEVIASISGDQVYSVLKYESGVHRVQRVPKTETQGRVHTSTVTVVVLPEADPVSVQIKSTDLRIDVCRSSGAGGQHVNTTDSAVRVVHLPTNITVYCQEGKSQHANKDRALKILYARVLDQKMEKQKKEESDKRKAQMGGGDRSQRIRTYNFPQSRVTDHRIALTQKNLSQVMQGDFNSLFSEVRLFYQNQALQEQA